MIKPREFQLTARKGDVWLASLGTPYKHGDIIHVIEMSALTALQRKYDELKCVVELELDEYVRSVGTWKIIQRLEEQVVKSEYIKQDALELVEALEFYLDDTQQNCITVPQKALSKWRAKYE